MGCLATDPEGLADLFPRDAVLITGHHDRFAC